MLFGLTRKKWKPPKNVIEVRSFLGLAGEYRRFVEWLSMIILPLTKLLQNDVRFEWKEKCQYSFEKLKIALKETLVLALPKPRREYVVYKGSSYSGLGCVLIQDGKVVVYASRQ